jgi:hypothetical protein
MHEAFRLGNRVFPETAIPAFELQRYTLADFREELAEVEAPLVELVAAFPSRPVMRCALAHVHARLGRHEEAHRALDELAAEDVPGLPLDQEWLYGTSLLAEVAVLVGDAASAEFLYAALSPWAGFTAADHPEGFRGSISRDLGVLAAMLERPEEAALHFDTALEANERMGLSPWLAHTQREYARLLLARNGAGDRDRAAELLVAALATYREVGMPGYVAEAEALAKQ